MGLFDRRRKRRCDEEVRAGAYLLCVRVLHAGTRSEGRIGRLYLDGKEVGGASGDIVEAAADGGTVRFVHRGDERPHIWSVSGWALATDEFPGAATSAPT